MTPAPSFAADPATVADRLAIMALTHHFENAFDDGDVEAHMATWAEEIAFESPFGSHDTREGYRGWVEQFSDQMQAMGGTRHLITNAVIAVDGARASQTCYLTILARTSEGGGPAVLATVRFEDDLVRTDAGWRFARRRLHLDQDPSRFGGG